MGIKEQAQQAKRVLEKALEKERPKEAIDALAALEKLEPREPRWPQRLGDQLKRVGRKEDAEAAYLRAIGLFSQQGFLPHAVAIAKVLVTLNPARADVLDRINQQSTRDLRRTLTGTKPAGAPPRPAAPAPARAVAAAPSPVAAASVEIDLSDLESRGRAAPPSPPTFAEPAPLRARGGRPVSKRESFIGGIPSAGLATAARPLRPAADVAQDEVRFADVPAEEWVEIDAADLEAMLPSDGAVDLEHDAPPDWGVTAERVALLSGATLFAEVSADALGALARAAELVELRPGEHVCRHGEPADSIYVIVEGMAYVVLPWLPGGGVDLAAGQIFGEGCLLQGGSRQADVRARGTLTLLRIAREDLQAIVASHPEVHRLLFDLLVQRLVANTLQTSPLFAAFAQEQRRELAHMFEVRRASAGVALIEQGKRSDGLYLLLAGEFQELDRGEWVRLQPGTLVGHRSLISSDPAGRTIQAASESVVLRMPARRFGTFAAQFPPAMAHLTKLATRTPGA